MMPAADRIFAPGFGAHPMWCPIYMPGFSAHFHPVGARRTRDFMPAKAKVPSPTIPEHLHAATTTLACAPFAGWVADKSSLGPARSSPSSIFF